MTNTIDILELLGQKPELDLDQKKLKSLFTEKNISNDVQQAILNNDHNELEILLGSRTNVVCIILTPENDDLENTQASLKLAC